MLHLPIAANRISQFAAKFEPLPTGDWAWFADDASAGLLVTDAERSDLIARHAAILERLERVQRWWLPLAFVVVLAIVIAGRGAVPDWAGPAIFVLPVPWMLWQAWRAERLPYRLTERRMAVAPPRGFRKGAAVRLRALPVAIPLLMIVLGAALLARLAWDGSLLASPWVAAEGVAVVLGGSGILWLRRRR